MTDDFVIEVDEDQSGDIMYNITKIEGVERVVSPEEYFKEEVEAE